MRLLLTALVIASTLLTPVNVAARAPECEALVAYYAAFADEAVLFYDAYYGIVGQWGEGFGIGGIGPEQTTKMWEGVDMMALAAFKARSIPAPPIAGAMYGIVLDIASDWEAMALKFGEGAASGESSFWGEAEDRMRIFLIHDEQLSDAYSRAHEAVCPIE